MKIIDEFEKKRNKYLGQRTMRSSLNTQQHNAAVCIKFLEFCGVKFNLYAIAQVKPKHYSCFVQYRQRQKAADETLRKESYVLNTFFNAAKLDIKVRPMARIKTQPVGQ